MCFFSLIRGSCVFRYPPLSGFESMGKNPFYNVEKLMALKVDPKTGERQFKARWVGYGAKDDSWVMEGDLNSDVHTFPLSTSVAKAMGSEANSTPKKKGRKSSMTTATPVSHSKRQVGSSSRLRTPGKRGAGSAEKAKKEEVESRLASANKEKATSTKRAAEANSADVRRSGRTRTPTKSASEMMENVSKTPKKHALEEPSNLKKTPRKRRKSSPEKGPSREGQLEGS